MIDLKVSEAIFKVLALFSGTLFLCMGMVMAFIPTGVF